MPEHVSVDLKALHVAAGARSLVAHAELHLESGWVVGLVGASGSGKSLTARSLCGLVNFHPGVIAADLSFATPEGHLSPYETPALWNRLRGRYVSYIPQDARGGLFPFWSVRRHFFPLTTPESWLERFFDEPSLVVNLYPHELSGGMAQRVRLALALARGSRILLVDEPTSAIDPTAASDVMDVFRDVVAQGVGLLWITHDLREVFQFANQIVVMHEGQTVDRCLGTDDPKVAFSHAAAQALVQATYPDFASWWSGK